MERPKELPLLADIVGWCAHKCPHGTEWRHITKRELDQGFYCDITPRGYEIILRKNWNAFHYDEAAA